MNLSLKSDIFKPFWAQLFLNIGYSKHYQRYVIVEPLGLLLKDEQIIKCLPVEPIVYPQVSALGNHIASYIDKEWGDCIEQILAFSKKYKTILLTDEDLIFQKGRLPELLIYLKKQPKIAQRVLGLIHYHIDEPRLSYSDIEAIDYFTTELKLVGGMNQIGIVVSEINPEDTLEAFETGKENFKNHLSSKLRGGKIDVVGSFFSGNQAKPVSIEIKLDS